MNISTSSILWGVLFSAIGSGYALYGKKRQAPVSFVSGVGLMVFPYFVGNPYALVAIGLVLSAAPFVIKL